MNLPTTILKYLVANHMDPYAWWYGQILSYALRLQESTANIISELKRTIKYRHPIVG